MITSIANYSLTDVKESIRYLLDKSAHSPEVRTLAVSITHNTEDKISAVYDWVKDNVSYIPDPVKSDGIIELFISPVRIAKDYNAGIAQGGDCITGDTPIWIKYNGLPDLAEVRELLPIGNYAQFSNVDILTPTGFQPLISIRRKQTNKPIIRLLDTSDIGLTNDHKIVSNPNIHDDTKYIQAINAKYTVKYYPDLDEIFVGDYELGWAYGLFFADGNCSIKRNLKTYGGEVWSISNINIDYLERAKDSLEKKFPYLAFYIRVNPSDRLPTNYGERTKPLATLCAKLIESHNDGTWGKFVRNQRAVFYSSLGIKKVPQFILHSNIELAKGFWDGVMAGDGDKKDLYITSASKISTLGLTTIAKKAGILPRVRAMDRFAAIKQTANNIKSYRYDGLVKISSNGISEVFDIATLTGEFIAGDIAVKNCDDMAILATALFRSIGISANVVIIDTMGEGLDHAVSEVWSDKLNCSILVDPSSKFNPVGWEIKNYGKITV